MTARYLMFTPIALAVALWTTAASSASISCEMCVTTCVIVDGQSHCSTNCFSVPCGIGRLRFEMSPTVKAKNGSVCTVRVKTTPNATAVPGKVTGHSCVLERPLH